MSRAVIWPRRALDDGDLIEADRRLEKLVADAAGDPRERSRLLTAYAIEVMSHFSGKGEAVPYLRRALTEARAGFAPDSRMVAMALSTYGEAEVEARGAAASAEAEAALVEALDIRLKRLGPRHVETLVASTTLGRLRGDPARTEGIPARIAEASALFDSLMEADAPEGGESIDHLFIEWIDMLIDNDQADAACGVLARLPGAEKRLGLNLALIGNHTGQRLRDAGHDRHARPLVPRQMTPGGVPTLAELEDSLDGPWLCGP